MSSPGNGQAVPYDVRMSAQSKEALKRFHRRAIELDIGHALLDALRGIVERLRTDPLTFGEPMYRLPSIRMGVRHGAIFPLYVDYAVHEEKPLVFIRGFRFLS
jgi:hypothetical protein